MRPSTSLLWSGITCPSTWMWPEVGSTSPMIMAIVVVLPAPLAPSSPVMLPVWMRNDRSSTARVVLYTLTRCATSIAADNVGSAVGSPALIAPSLVMRPFLGPLLRQAQGIGEAGPADEFVIGSSRGYNS